MNPLWNRRNFLIRTLYVAFDVGCALTAFYIALCFKPSTVPFDVSLSGFFSSNNPFKALFLVWILVLLFFNQVHGLYQTHREQVESREVAIIIRSVLISTLVVIVLAYLLKVQDFPRSVLFLSIALIIALFSIWRAIKKQIVEYLVRQGYNNFNAIIIGAGRVGLLVAEEIQKRPGLGIRVVGFLDDAKRETSSKVTIIGGIKHFQDIAKREFINKVFITEYQTSDLFVRVLEQAKEMQIAVHVVPQGYEWMNNDVTKYNLGIIPILAYSEVEVNYRQRAKRIFDFCMSWVIVIALSPVLALIAILIKLDSPGPVLYFSKRYGKGGRMFDMYKFRSMVVNADDMLKDLKCKNEVGGPIFKMRKDPRVTKLGAFLRKYSLDELPQFFNVIKGDMSLVGPRPFPLDQVEKEDYRQLKRLNTRPGITGLWQIKGRSDVSFDRLLRWDTWYINNWSFGLDIYILWQTIPTVLQGRGAY